MATLKYKLRDNSTKIQLLFSYGRNKLFRITTGFSLNNSKNWDENRQVVKSIISEPNAALINIRLKELNVHFTSAYEKLTAAGNPIDNDILKEIFLSFDLTPKVVEQKVTNDFLDVFEDFIKNASNARHKGKRLSEGTIKTYKTTKNILVDFQKEHGKIHFRNVDIAFYNRLLNFCEAKGYSKNYIGKAIKNLKTFLKFASDVKGIELPKAYNPSKFNVLKEDINDIYLSNDELIKIFNLDLSGFDKKYSVVRDIFLIGAFTGLRVSDYNRLTENNLINIDGKLFFEVIARKTDTKVIIPVADIVKEIIDRNNGLLPSVPEQIINRLIKEIGESAGIDERVVITKTIGGEKKEMVFHKFDLIKTHTARRSFCTNAYLGGLDTLSIMAVSQHTTEVNFLKYIKVTKQQQAERIANHPYFKGLSSANLQPPDENEEK